MTMIIFFFQKGSDVSCPLHSADFINDIEQIMTQRFHAKTEHDCREPGCKLAIMRMCKHELWGVVGVGHSCCGITWDLKIADLSERLVASV